MLKASALYIVIIIAVIIAIFSATLISTAYFYRLEYQKNIRFNRLSANLSSAMAIALSSNQKAGSETSLDLYGEGTDSVEIHSEGWGLYSIATIKSFTQKDTLKRAFLIGNSTTDPAAIYLSDEDRPLSVSGSTEITGEAVLPKAGIKQAYVEARPYSGSKLVYGAIKNSERTLPALNESCLGSIQKILADTVGKAFGAGSLRENSFYNQLVKQRFHKALTLDEPYKGKILIVSDTTIRISRDAELKDIIVAAPAIVVEEGFRGSCQLFASDSVVIGRNAVFNYPSAIGILKSPDSKIQSKIQLGGGCVFEGILFSYEKSRSDLQTIISLGKGSLVKGEVYSCGYIKMEKPLTVLGKVSCNRFIIQTPTTLYENYLLDITINRNKRSPYYLSSLIFNSQQENKKVLKWLN